MKTIMKVVLSVLLVSLVITGGVVFYLSRGLNEGKSIDLKGIDLPNIEDGIYVGEYEAGRWTNKLKIEIQDNIIRKVEIKDDVTFKKMEVTEELFDRVLKEQDTRVDLVSGATVTSKAYLKAIENGLSND